MSKKISQLTTATDVTTSDLFQMVDVEDGIMSPSGTNKKVTAQLLANELAGIVGNGRINPAKLSSGTLPSGITATATGSATARTLANRFADVVNVRDFGAIGNNIADDTAAIQAAINSIQGTQPTGGGVVYFPKGIYRTSSPISVYSDVHLKGDGHTQTYIKPLNSASFAENQAVIQSVNFPTVQGTNIWDYYSPYPTGLVMGFGMSGITIDGNRGNVANAGGLYIYGGKWTFENIGVINTSSHGIWTEAGLPISSTSGDDLHDYLNMHESFADNVYISNANKHGWFFRGPNDSSIGDIQIKTCQWAGFYQDLSRGNASSGNLEIQNLHAYACSCLHDADGAMIEIVNANIGFVYVDASAKNGIRFYGSGSIAGEILVLSNNKNNSGSFWGVITDVATQIGMIRNTETVARTSGVNGGLVNINQPTLIGQVRSVQNPSTTIAEKCINVNNQCFIGNAVIEVYDSVGSIGVDVSSQKVVMTVQAKNCLNAISYNTSGRNRIYLNSDGCTTDITYNVSAANTDSIEVQSTNNTIALFNTGKIQTSLFSFNITTIASTSSYTPDLNNTGYLKLVPLSNNITFNQPTSSSLGDVLDIYIQQDGTGGYGITWDSAYKTGYVNTGNTAFKRHHITFVYDGSFWIERSRTGWF